MAHASPRLLGRPVAFVYILTNPFTNGLKIRFAESNAEERLDECSGARGVPARCEVAYAVKVADTTATVARIHASLCDSA